MRRFRTLGPSQPWLRYGIAAATWAAYLAAAWASQERFEAVLRPLASVPVIATGVLLGWRWGLASSLAAPPVLIAVHVAHGNGDSLLADLNENLFRWIVGVLLGWGSGFMAEQVRQGREAEARLNSAAAEQQALKAGLEEAQAIAHLGSWEADLTTGETRWSNECWRILGLPKGSLHPSQETFLRIVHPADRERVRQTIAEGLAEMRIVEFECRVVRPGGEVRHLLARNVPTAVLDGKVVRLSGTHLDVTEAKVAEDRLRQVAQSIRAVERRAADTGRRLAAVIAASPLPILQAGPDLRLTAWNPAAQRLLGWTEDEAVGQATAILVPPSDAAATAQAWEELRAGRGVVREDVPRLRKDGSEVPVSIHMAPLMDEDGFQGAVGILLDMAAQHEAEASRQRAQRLEEVAAFKTQFLNNAAHELATPLTPIKLQVASLQRSVFGGLTPRQQDAVGLVDRNLNRLGRLVQDLLDAARLQSGHLRIAMRPVEPGRVAQDVVASFAEKARQDGVALAVRRLGSPVQIVGDEARLSQVLFNLVHNALKFTPRGGRVEVSLRSAAGEAVMSVADTGAGMTEEQISRLFQPFTQVHDPAIHDVGGTGLGLYISRGIVEQHGGRLLCRSDGRGRGTTFEVHLPLRPVEHAKAEAPQRREGERAES